MAENEMCASCLRDKEKSIAKLWCYTCWEPNCESCGKVHRRFSIPHTVVDINKVPETDRRMSKTCSTHYGQILNSYCSNHEKLVCPACTKEIHNKCKDIVSVELATKVITDGIAIKNLKTRMENQMIVIHNISENLTQCGETLNKDKRSILDEISKIREMVNCKLDLIEKGVLHKFYQLEQNISEGKKDLERTKNTTQSNIESIDKIPKNFSDTWIFYQVKHTEDMQNSCEKITDGLRKDMDSFKLNSVPANFTRKLTDLFSSLDGTGYVDQYSMTDDFINSSKISIDIKTASKLQTLVPTKGFVFGASCFTEDNRIVLAESKWDSKHKLSIFDRSGRAGRISISLPEEPNRICPFEKSHILVTCKGKLPILVVDSRSITTEIKRINPSIDRLSLKEKLKSSESSFISAKGSQIWVNIQCSTAKRDYSYICNVNSNGDILKSISAPSDICDMCFNVRNDSFIMTQSGKSDILEISISGDEKLYYHSSDLCSRCIIASDSSGGLFLSEPKTNTIYKLRFGEKRSVLSGKDGPVNVSYINFNNRSCELVVTGDGGCSVNVFHVQT